MRNGRCGSPPPGCAAIHGHGFSLQQELLCNVFHAKQLFGINNRVVIFRDGGRRPNTPGIRHPQERIRRDRPPARSLPN
ncbi:MAG: hypothetical protein ING97_05960 [Gemmatimonas sp.]|nr:hypothetical protein [Gemmatimonas sp.]